MGKLIQIEKRRNNGHMILEDVTILVYVNLWASLGLILVSHTFFGSHESWTFHDDLHVVNIVISLFSEFCLQSLTVPIKDVKCHTFN
jgi:hypothetical protein